MLNNANKNKRILLTEGNLMQLWFEVQQVLNEDTKNDLTQKFKQLLNKTQLVLITPIDKKGANNG